MGQPAVYILASKRKVTLYVGVTRDLIKRVYEHKSGFVEGFTKRYCVYALVYYELHEDVYTATNRERQIKRWCRAWKVELIENGNPDWVDLFDGLLEG